MKLPENSIADFEGEVVRGSGRGRELGFPTINVRLSDSEKMSIEPGVYAAGVVLSGAEYLGALHFGANPTFDKPRLKVEIFLLDFEGEIYGEMVKVRVLKRMRGTVKFDSPEELSEQIAKDVEDVIDFARGKSRL